MRKRDELLLEVTDQLEMDVYHSYKKERRAFVEETRTGITASVVFEFIKPFINFERISGSVKLNYLTFSRELHRIE